MMPQILKWRVQLFLIDSPHEQKQKKNDLIYWNFSSKKIFLLSEKVGRRRGPFFPLLSESISFEEHGRGSGKQMRDEFKTRRQTITEDRGQSLKERAVKNSLMIILLCALLLN